MNTHPVLNSLVSPANGAQSTENVDRRILSKLVAGGFVGAYIAMYASRNGHESTNHVDFDWFEYLGLDES